MNVVRSVTDARLDPAHRWALVPTMGAFHEGHLSLMRKARYYGDRVAVSLFVNPTQFKAGEDFDKYPRNEATDFAMAEAAGVDLMFAPSVEEMYADSKTSVHVSGVSDLWEGEWRPGHFDGVATVVAKLFNILLPQVAVFGQKDFQQCAVIRQMVEDLNFSISLHFEETIREADGLAMSSRNRYLNQEERAKAPMIYESLMWLKERLQEPANEEVIKVLVEEQTDKLTSAGFSVDYLEVVDANTLLQSYGSIGTRRILAAARLGFTRLIDNVLV